MKSKFYFNDILGPDISLNKSFIRYKTIWLLSTLDTNKSFLLWYHLFVILILPKTIVANSENDNQVVIVNLKTQIFAKKKIFNSKQKQACNNKAAIKIPNYPEVKWDYKMRILRNLNPKSIMGGGDRQCDAKFSEKCPCLPNKEVIIETRPILPLPQY